MIVAVDNSTDSSRSELSLDSDRRMRIIHLYRNSGSPARAKSVEVKVSTGKWIVFLDADDTWDEGTLAKQVCRECPEMLKSAIRGFMSRYLSYKKQVSSDEFKWRCS